MFSIAAGSGGVAQFDPASLSDISERLGFSAVLKVASATSLKKRSSRLWALAQ
jgi:hypothetical protein